MAPTDHTYLHLDTRGRPMHWAMVLELSEGAGISVADVRARVRERSGHFDVFRIGIRHGGWRKPQVVQAESVDVDRHVDAVEHTDRADLYSRIADLMATPLPRSAPLWHITLFTPRDQGAQHVVLRVHHSLSDGIAGAAFAALLADGAEEDLAEFDRFATTPRHRIPTVDPRIRQTAKATFDSQWKAGNAGRGWPALTRTGRREIALVGTPTRELRRTAKRHDATVHEFLLAAIGRTLATAAPVTGKPHPATLRVTLPVTDDPAFRHTGNAVLAALLNLPGDETDLAGQIARCRTELATIEKGRPHLAWAPTDDAPKVPWPVRRAIANASLARMSPDIHIGINPGFSRVRSVLGASIVDLTPLSPLIGYSFSVTSLILGSRTSFGIVTDPAALPEGYATVFAERFAQVLDEAGRS
nr:wax ester/triacylglycerol synthase domain-containing protein [Nocardia bovistercoris]